MCKLLMLLGLWCLLDFALKIALARLFPWVLRVIPHVLGEDIMRRFVVTCYWEMNCAWSGSGSVTSGSDTGSGVLLSVTLLEACSHHQDGDVPSLLSSGNARDNLVLVILTMYTQCSY